MTTRERIEKLHAAYGEFANIRHPLDILGQTNDPWFIGAAVILSAHCTDMAVNKMMGAFVARFPNPKSLIETTKDEVVKFLPGISHSGNKATYLVNWANHLVSHQGNPGQTIAELTVVSGIGRKTAALILYYAQGIDEGIALDLHALRVMDRLAWYPPTKNPNVREKQMLADIPVGQRNKTHSILTHLGRRICRPTPQCEACSLMEMCEVGSA